MTGLNIKFRDFKAFLVCNLDTRLKGGEIVLQLPPTFNTSIELSSQRDVSVPTPRVDADKASFHRWVNAMSNKRVLILVGLVIL